MATRRTIGPVPDLSKQTIGLLLDGWGRDREPPGPPDPFSGFGRGFGELYETNGPERLWRQHEAYLRATAQAWGWAPEYVGPDGRARFYAEALADGVPVEE